MKKNNNVDCIGILKYLENYSDKTYYGKDKRTAENRAEMEKKEREAQYAKNELDKMAKICENHFKLEKANNSISWTSSGTHQKLKDYLWVQLKDKRKKEYPESISIFVEKSDINKKSRFRFSLEFDNKKGDSDKLKKYHKHLELPLKREKGLVYVIGSNEKRNISITHETQKDLIKGLNLGKYEKVQISKVVEWTDDLTDEKCIKEMIDAIHNLLPYYKYVVEDIDKKGEVNNLKMLNCEKNMILYGPPGTGKTYKTATYAVAICDPETPAEKLNDYEYVMKRYKELKEEGKIEFVTFHQSYGYEEFIEGIKPELYDEEESEKDLIYKIEPGIFKKFCEKIENSNISQKLDIPITSFSSVWKVSLKKTGDNDLRKECMKNEYIRIGWDDYGKDITNEKEYKSGGKNVLNAFISKMKKGDIVLSCYSEETIDAVGIVIGEYEWHDEYNEYKRLRKVKWLAKDLNYNILELNDNYPLTLPAIYKLSRITPSDALKIVQINKKQTEKKDNYVFIIDEINRGNISKIFGELITIIESTKRLGEKEETKVRLPYSNNNFGVPNNVYILGTMNTSDKSIALIDSALRRRFQFIEMMPNLDVLRDIKIGELDISKMLETINNRIEILYDKDHTIGHSYFMDLKNDATIEKLASIFEYKIIPLLQEYFYEDYAKIQLILGNKIIKKEEINIKEIFKENIEGIDLPEEKYTISKDALKSIESYIDIYK